MKVLFLEDDRVQEVAEGYARNYLLPRNMAIKVTPHALAAADKRKDQKKAELDKKRGEMQALAKQLAEAELLIQADAGEGGKLFGSVTTADIADEIKKSTGIEIDKRKIELIEPIKTLGDHGVVVKLYHDINARLTIKVAPK